ncbi:MAG: peptidoglycan-binding protein [Burkholderiales bacterium RIFCSPLOWO2_02_FULL_57_36]|nr:MAG: peptidoglycan-binding protein [Burkholderiales bacterium RIFCSPLOWO2_02_FULL_57_36]
MAGFSTGLKEKLKISPCQVDAGKITVDTSLPYFEALINPSGYKHQFSISYNKKKTLGQAGAEPKFNAICPEKLTLPELVLDGTGVVALLGMEDVTTLVERLMSVIYAYQGEKHEPNYVRFLWGSLIFFGRVESIAIDYTLFKPSGEPLRAKVQLGVVGWMSTEEITLRSNRSSPDLSHIVEVKAGDSLPLLCNRIYKNSSYYLEVARVNNLTNFRDLKPGLKLRFPPLS